MKIVAIGGRESTRPNYSHEIDVFDKEIVKMAGKINPALLFIGFAAKYNAGTYFARIEESFTKLNCRCVHLEEKDLEDEVLIKEKIACSDIIYVGGGNTLRLMNLFRKHGLDKLFENAGKNGAVLCGVSAGAICWCKYGNSDSRKYTSNSTQLIRVTGLGFVNVLFCPHYNTQIIRQTDLKRMMAKTPKIVALAIDENVALKINGNEYEILKTGTNAKARKCYWKNGNYVIEELDDKGFLKTLFM